MSVPPLNLPNTVVADDTTTQRLDDVVRAVWVACHPPTRQEVPGQAVNHWRLYLTTSFGNPDQQIPGSSVVLDMVKNFATPNDTTGVLGVQFKHYATSWNVIKNIPCVPAPGTTVRDIITGLHEGNMLKYRYTKGGEGCRYWVGSVIRVLEQHLHYVEAGSLARVEEALPFLWDRDANGSITSLRKEMVKGTFYG